MHKLTHAHTHTNLLCICWKNEIILWHSLAWHVQFSCFSLHFSLRFCCCTHKQMYTTIGNRRISLYAFNKVSAASFAKPMVRRMMMAYGRRHGKKKLYIYTSSVSMCLNNMLYYAMIQAAHYLRRGKATIKPTYKFFITRIWALYTFKMAFSFSSFLEYSLSHI